MQYEGNFAWMQGDDVVVLQPQKPRSSFLCHDFKTTSAAPLDRALAHTPMRMRCGGGSLRKGLVSLSLDRATFGRLWLMREPDTTLATSERNFGGPPQPQ